MRVRVRRSKTEPDTQEKGWALVSVLLVVAVLTMMAGAVEALILTSARIESRTLERDRTEADLDAAIVRAVLGIADPRIDQRWRVDGVSQTFPFDGQNIRVSVQDELGRIDLNAADGSLILQLLQWAGLDADAANAMRDRILDWRSSIGDLRRLHGATDSDYAQAGYKYRPRHGLFQSVEELQLVMGMDKTLFAKLKPAITVYSGRPSIDANVAPEEALRAFYSNDEAMVDDILAKRAGENKPADSQQTAPATRAGVLPLSLPLAGRSFVVQAQVDMGTRRYTREAVVTFTGDVQRPYLIRHWQ